MNFDSSLHQNNVVWVLFNLTLHCVTKVNGDLYKKVRRSGL